LAPYCFPVTNHDCRWRELPNWRTGTTCFDVGFEEIPTLSVSYGDNGLHRSLFTVHLGNEPRALRQKCWLTRSPLRICSQESVPEGTTQYYRWCPVRQRRLSTGWLCSHPGKRGNSWYHPKYLRWRPFVPRHCCFLLKISLLNAANNALVLHRPSIQASLLRSRGKNTTLSTTKTGALQTDAARTTRCSDIYPPRICQVLRGYQKTVVFDQDEERRGKVHQDLPQMSS